MILLIYSILFFCALAICAIIISSIAETHNLIHPVPNEKTKKNYNTYLQGAIGEFFCRFTLSRLPQEFKILHTYKIPKYGDIDHIVIGPTGIFVID